MAFDMGFNFRATAGFVTDPAYAVPVLLENYPHTYTNGNGLSINAGWSGPGTVSSADRNNALDVRLAGINYEPPSNDKLFSIDLSSGSAPGAGAYTLDAALGDTAANAPSFYIKDNTTILSGLGVLDGANGANQWYDVTGVLRTSASDWVTNHATASATFSTTTVVIDANPAGHQAGYAVLAHFRLTRATPSPGGGPVHHVYVREDRARGARR